jgi:hypothetical protein
LCLSGMRLFGSQIQGGRGGGSFRAGDEKILFGWKFEGGRVRPFGWQF